MAASTGYWGSPSPSGTVVFTLCPSGLCCPGGGCAWNEVCSSLHRDNAVPLCGACQAGYSATVGSNVCRATADCKDARWFVPGLLLLALLWTQVVLVGGASASPSSGSHVSQAAEVAQLVLYFYQMAPLLSVGNTLRDEVLSVVAGTFNMQLHAPSADGFACPFPGLTTLQEIALQYVMPVLVGVALLFRYQVERCTRRRGKNSPCPVEERFHNRFLTAVPPLLATAFTTLLMTTFKLLHCVPVGSEAVVFRAAGVLCDKWWRTPLFFVAAALLLPMAAALAARASPAAALWWAARPWQRKAWAKAVATKMRAPFVCDCWHWAAVLALQRLVVVAVYAFVSETASRSVCQAFVMLCFLVLHTGCRPFAQPVVQHVQTALLIVLTLVAVLNVPLAVLQTGAFATISSNPMDGIADRLNAAEAVLLVAPGALLAAAAFICMWLERTELAAALARNTVWFARSVVCFCPLPCCKCRRQTVVTGQQRQLGTPLLNPAGDEGEVRTADARQVGVLASATSSS